jgi:hypothetical protein
MLNITNITRLVWVTLVVMAATVEASAQTTFSVIAKDSIPYSASPQDTFSKAPLGQFEFNMHLCVKKEYPIFGNRYYLQFILPSGEPVYSELRYREAFTRDPAGDEKCESIGAQAPTQPKGMNQRTGDAVAATGTAAQTSGTVPNGGVAGSFEEGAAAEKQGDWNRARYFLEPLAEQGDPRAQNALGHMYQEGESFPQDYAKAVIWYRKAADQGNARAEMHLGLLYYNGAGVPKDYDKAMQWEHKAADQGDADAQVRLAFMYFDRVPNNFAEAMKWDRKAAAQGDADAQDLLTLAPKFAARKEIGDTVCTCDFGGEQHPPPCSVYGQVENVHNDKIEVRKHFHQNGTVVPSIGSLPGWSTPSKDYDQLDWTDHDRVIKCEE